MARIQKWGNGQGLRLSKKMLQKAGISIGDKVNVSIHSGRIVVEPAIKVKRIIRLNRLIARITKDYRPEEKHWGDAVGLEAW